ncbi:MAG: hypothetical protein OXN17_15515 [Candidatus Poribacteria bacterium]|nr:hypothetical protein [Candidatus Poribacteria bacterium]MDE0505675.1 hypothetical protein [Candidatus Poribacteria bacterium]
MKRKPWSIVIAALDLFITPTLLAHAISSVIYIHELVEKSDIVFFGRVTGTQFVFVTPHIIGLDGGSLYTMRIDRVLYGGEKIKQAIFSETDLNEINKKLKQKREDSPVTLLAYRDENERHTEGPMFADWEPRIYFLKISKFPEFLPDTAVIMDENWSQHARESELRSKSDLKEERYFQASFRNEQATWQLSREYYQKKLPVLEAFCEVISIPDLDQRKKGLQRLEKHPDKWISSSAWAELRKINQPKPPKRKPTPPDQETQSTD